MKKIVIAMAALVLLSSVVFGTIFVSGQDKEVTANAEVKASTNADAGCDSGICGPGLCDGKCQGACGIQTCGCRA